MERDADAVQRAVGPRVDLRDRGGSASGWSSRRWGIVRREDVRSSRGDRGRARAQGGSSGEGGAAAGRGVGDAQPSSGRDPRSARRPIRRHARREAGRLLARHRGLCRLRPGGDSEGGLHRGGAVSDPARRGRLALRVHESSAERRLPRLRRDPSGVGIGEAHGRARRFDSAWIRSSSGCGTCSSDGDVFATGEVVHDVNFAECLRASADAIGWDDGRGGKGLCVLLKGMQTPSRASIAIEKESDGIRPALRDDRDGAGRPARALSDCGAAPGSRARARALPRPRHGLVPFDTRTTSSRSTLHDGTRARGRRRRPSRKRRRSRGWRGRERGWTRSRDGPGHRLLALAPGRRCGRGVRRRGDRRGLGRPACTLPCMRARSSRLPERSSRTRARSSWGSGPPCSRRWHSSTVRSTNANLSDYEIPSIADLPPITHDLLEKPGAEVHGLGETALPPVPAAIGNALASLGIHVRELPMTAEAVLQAIDARTTGGSTLRPGCRHERDHDSQRCPTRRRRRARRDVARRASASWPAKRQGDVRDRGVRLLHRPRRRSGR